MRIPFFPFLLLLAPVSQCRTPGQTWGGAFKPTGLNTIIRNQCITENKRLGGFHHAGTKEGRAMSKLLGRWRALSPARPSWHFSYRYLAFPGLIKVYKVPIVPRHQATPR